jgi:hypothetical protein
VSGDPAGEWNQQMKDIIGNRRRVENGLLPLVRMHEV